MDITQEVSSVNTLKRMEEKELFEKYSMNNQKELAIATLEEEFAAWKKDQFYRRKRFVQQHGLQAALEKGYHVPFWQWWMNKLLLEHATE